MKVKDIKNKDGGRGLPDDREIGELEDVKDNINFGFNCGIDKTGSLNLKCDVEKMAKVIADLKKEWKHEKFSDESLSFALAQSMSDWLYVEEEK